jgi:hypothetical protein
MWVDLFVRGKQQGEGEGEGEGANDSHTDVYHLTNPRSLVLQVRAAAYRSLAAYSPETLEGIDALRPLCDVTALLLNETDPAATSACEELVQATLAFEHSQRRR